MYVNPAFLEVQVDALRVPSDLAKRIEHKLESAGIRPLTAADLDRDPSLHRRLPVWGAGSHDSCTAAPVTVDEVVLGIVDRFIDDVREANSADVAESTS